MNTDYLDKKAYLSFRLDKELFAVSVTKVLEVLQMQELTTIPKAPDYILGVINFRGDILPVINMRKKFDLPIVADMDKYVIIVFELEIHGNRLLLGAIVDGVKDVLNINEEDLKRVPEFGTYNAEFIRGMIKAPKGFILVLNIDKVFSVEEVKIIQANSEEMEAVLEKTESKDENEIDDDDEFFGNKLDNDDEAM